MKRTVLVILMLVLVFSVVGAASAADGYTHPSGAFSMTPYGELVDEVANGALFGDETSLVAVLFGQATVQLNEESLPLVVSPMLDGLDTLASYTLDMDNMATLQNGYFIHLEYTLADEVTGSGDVFVTQDGETLYMMVLLTDDYAASADAWAATIDSFVPGVPEMMAETPVVEEEPTAAPPLVTDEAEIANGFDPTVDGFSFENYGNDIAASNLTSAEMQRMFGDSVCANLANGECTLTPPAEKWMTQINDYMDGGHCEGMAVLSALMYYNQVKPADFGASETHDLAIEGNDPLQREIAYWWTTQSTWPAAAVRVNESPSVVVQTLQEYFQKGKQADEWWAMGFYRRDGSAGHAVTPIGVEDKGDGLYNIQLYDNNFPNEVRIMEVDTNNETWQYEGSPNPEVESFLYDGDAGLQNLEIVAISPRLETQQCDFCAGGASAAGEGGTLNSLPVKQSTAPQAESSGIPIWDEAQARWALLIDGQTTDFYQVWLTGKSELLVTDSWGRSTGFFNGELINEIPGAKIQNMRIFFQGDDTGGTDKDKSPVLRIPVGLSFAVEVDGTNLAEEALSDVALIGPGYYLDVSGIYLEPGDIETINVAIDKSRHQINYYTDYSESPDIELGLETEEADYALLLRATELVGSNDSFTVAVDMATHEFIINTSDNTDPSTYEVQVYRVDDEAAYVFGASDVVMDPENTAYIPFTEWDGPGASLRVDFDVENDGEIDGTYELPDITAEVGDFYAEE
jgi:hypothetical protein